jgi:hypothetical protein
LSRLRPCGVYHNAAAMAAMTITTMIKLRMRSS